MEFDPNGASAPGSGIFGLPHGPEDAYIHVYGVPFEATTSYGGGTAGGPAAVLEASRQIDLFDLLFGRPYERGIWMAPIDPEIESWSRQARALAAPLIEKGGAEPGDGAAVAEIDRLGAEVNAKVRGAAKAAFDRGKFPVTLGGDHSTPFGAIAEAAARFDGLGILQFDAHADLRPAFEGLRWSHASILHNVLAECPGISSLVQVGIRDLCEQEYHTAESDPRIHAVYDRDLDRARFDGKVRELARRTIAKLPDHLHVTFDIDALDPALCPNTGTPVPNGLRWDETMVWLEELHASGKRVVSLDLNEVSAGPRDSNESETGADSMDADSTDAGQSDSDPWDAVVGARLLYRLIGASITSSSRPSSSGR